MTQGTFRRCDRRKKDIRQYDEIYDDGTEFELREYVQYDRSGYVLTVFPYVAKPDPAQ